jgi:hypothetical protein
LQKRIDKTINTQYRVASSRADRGKFGNGEPY